MADHLRTAARMIRLAPRPASQPRQKVVYAFKRAQDAQKHHAQGTRQYEFWGLVIASLLKLHFRPSTKENRY